MEKTRTFRSQLLGDVVDLLKYEGMSCADSADALVEIVVALSRYQEEGVTLYPRFILCDSLEHVLPVVQGTERLDVGRGSRSVDTAKLALKRCAPLARGPWVGFIERAPQEFRFGVFRESASPVSLDLRDTLIGLKGVEGAPNMLLVTQLADKVVELLGAKGQHLVFHLSAATDDQPSPLSYVETLATTISHQAPAGSREALASFLRTALADALRRGHGTLIAVTEEGRPTELGDGVPFDNPVDLLAAVEAHEATPTTETLGRLLAYAELLVGVLSTDGIAIFSTAGKLLGYSSFVRQHEKPEAAPSTLAGGARRRAHEILRELVDQKKLCAAFMRSSDGAATIHSRGLR